MDPPVPEEFRLAEVRGVIEEPPAGGFNQVTGDIRTTTTLITVALVCMRTPTRPVVATLRTSTDRGLGVVPLLIDLVPPASDPIRHLLFRNKHYLLDSNAAQL
jgi:hypothetical protein